MHIMFDFAYKLLNHSSRHFLHVMSVFERVVDSTKPRVRAQSFPNGSYA